MGLPDQHVRVAEPSASSQGLLLEFSLKSALFLYSRLAIIGKQGLQEKYGVPKPVLGRPETQRPPGRGREHLVTCNNLTSAAKPHRVILSPESDGCAAQEQ